MLVEELVEAPDHQDQVQADEALVEMLLAEEVVVAQVDRRPIPQAQDFVNLYKGRDLLSS